MSLKMTIKEKVKNSKIIYMLDFINKGQWPPILFIVLFFHSLGQYINNSNNPPKVSVEFFDDIKNINLINCYSNEENTWRKSELNIVNNKKIEINLKGKFTTERGRINCSLQEKNNYWRWLGIQFVLADK